MQVFMAKDILSSIPACWDTAAKLPLDAAYREELLAAHLIDAGQVGDGWIIKRTELGEKFLYCLQKQDKAQAETSSPIGMIPGYADLRKALEIFNLITDCFDIYANEWYETMSGFLGDKTKDDEPSDEEIRLYNKISEKMTKSLFKDLKDDIKKKAEENFKNSTFKRPTKIKTKMDSNPFKSLFRSRFNYEDFMDDILNKTDNNIHGFFIYHDDEDDDM